MHARAVAALLLVAGVRGEEHDEAACRALGFAPSLVCSSCDKLGEFVDASDSLVAECRGCCTEEVAGASGKYASAVLDICK
jgi:hypothetical protein